MAVRVFDQSDSQSTRLAAVEPAPLRRQDLRRIRHRWTLVGILALAVPFLVSVIVLGVAH